MKQPQTVWKNLAKGVMEPSNLQQLGRTASNVAVGLAMTVAVPVAISTGKYIAGHAIPAMKKIGQKAKKVQIVAYLIVPAIKEKVKGIFSKKAPAPAPFNKDEELV